jgi:murein L,D-transpeptidase YafK
VALGSGGVGKARQGDKRTPLGSYPLGEPRASQKFGTFIPVAYPTPTQRKRGYTGGAVGVHGPPTRVPWIGRLFDWTAGCVALASRAEIEEVADWARRAHPVAIHLE